MTTIKPQYQFYADAIVAWAEERGCDVRLNYSGRGMYGKTCLGIVVDTGEDVYDLYFHLGWITHEDAVERNTFDPITPPKPSTDSMGLSRIVYWPSIAVTTNAEGEDDCD